MHPDKSLGSDGMTPCFFQKHWKIVGEDIIKLVRNFFKDGMLNKEMNATNIVLISKKKCPSLNSDMRPITLCNVVVKIITKVVANRLKGVLELVISDR